MAAPQGDAIAGALDEASRADATQTVNTTESIVPPTPGDQQFEDAMESQQTPAPTTIQNDPIAQSPVAEPSPAQPALTRKETEALGPATENPTLPASTGHQLSINLMLVTGQRHPYKIDEKYLNSRSVDAKDSTGAFSPLEISGYQLKELILRDWRSEWEQKPASASSIRLILLGRMIEDKTQLKALPFKLDTTNVVHMTIKPPDLEEDEAGAAKGSGKSGSMRMRDGGEGRNAGCRCVVL